MVPWLSSDCEIHVQGDEPHLHNISFETHLTNSSSATLSQSNFEIEECSVDLLHNSFPKKPFLISLDEYFTFFGLRVFLDTEQLRQNTKRSLSIYGLREDPSLCSFSLWLETRPRWRNLLLTQSLSTHWVPCVPLWTWWWNPFPRTT